MRIACPCGLLWLKGWFLIFYSFLPSWVALAWLVTRARVLKKRNNDLTHLAGSVSASPWLARSKLRIEPCDLGEGLGLVVPSVEAGFTEQRRPPALNSGTITGWCASEPKLPSESGSIEPSLLKKTLLKKNYSFFFLGFGSTIYIYIYIILKRIKKEKNG